MAGQLHRLVLATTLALAFALFIVRRQLCAAAPSTGDAINWPVPSELSEYLKARMLSTLAISRMKMYLMTCPCVSG